MSTGDCSRGGQRGVERDAEFAGQLRHHLPPQFRHVRVRITAGDQPAGSPERECDADERADQAQRPFTGQTRYLGTLYRNSASCWQCFVDGLNIALT